LFNSADINKDGFLTADEIGGEFERMGERVSDEKLAMYLDLYD